MARRRRINLGPITGFTKVDTGDGFFVVLTAWLDAGAMEKARMGWEASGQTAANMVTRPGLQVANVETAPDAAVTLGADTLTSSGVKFPSAFTDVRTTTQGRQLARLGLWVKNPSGTTTLQCVLLHNAWLELDEI